MHLNRNEKVNQVDHLTLVVGIDIAKSIHYACVVDERGRELKTAFAVRQSHDGFKQFGDKIRTLALHHRKRKILVGFEPTGHYWMNLAAYLTRMDIDFVMVNPMHVNRSKELDDNLQTKSDQKDARVIAKLITNGNFSYPRVLSGVEAELRQGCSIRRSLQKDIAKLKNRMIRWTDRYFPEFPSVYKSFGQNACAILKHAPLPADLLEIDMEKLIERCRDMEGISRPAKPKIERLRQVAAYSIGLNEGTVMARQEIATLLAQFELLQRQLTEVEELLMKLAKELTDYKYLTSIPGIGAQTVCQLLAEAGSLKQYRNPRQLIKLAGLTLREHSSGQLKGQKRISKRGRKDLRSLLYRAVLPLIRNNEVFGDLYQYYIARQENPLRKKEALLVLCSKLLKIFHGLAKHETTFDAGHMRRDLTCLKETC